MVTIITDGYENASKEWSFSSIKKLIEECKADGWMFSFIGAGEDIVKTASTISVTNTVVWEKTAKGTAEIFANENSAQSRFYDKMARVSETDIPTRRRMRQKFCEEYYDKDKK